MERHHDAWGAAMMDARRAAAWWAIAAIGWAPSLLAQDRPVRYTVVPEASVVRVHTYKGGLFGRFGHEHDIRAHAFSGTVIYDARDPSASHADVSVRTDRLLVVPASDSSDIPEITKAMREQVLHVDRFPYITFTSAEVTAHDSTVHIRGDLTMVGRTRRVAMDLTLQRTPDALRVRGSFTVKQTDFGIRPYSAAMGTIKVKNEITFVVDIEAVAVQ